MPDLDDDIATHLFESLGHNCEFGFVLQGLGSHESSLLRWAYLETVETLIGALETRFEGLFADPATLVPRFGMTMVEDAALGIAFHTKIQIVIDNNQWVIVRDADFPAIHKNEFEKIGYMRDRFLESLSRADKIFVYKENSGVSDHDAKRLHAALKLYGPNRLLVVDAGGALIPAGSIFKLDEGLYRGFIPRFSAYDAVDQVDMAGWKALLKNMQSVIDNMTPGVKRNTAPKVDDTSSSAKLGTIENNVLVGHEGYLFLAGGSHNVFDIVTGKGEIAQSSFDAFRTNLQGRICWAARNVVPYMHLIMPDKQSIIPQHWPLTPPIKIGAEYIKRNSDIAQHIMYPVQELGANYEHAVSHVDTHLRDYGSILVATLLVEKISQIDQTEVKNWLLSGIGKKQIKKNGDLGMKLTPPVEGVDEVLDIAVPGKFFHNNIDGGHDGIVDLLFNPGAFYQKRVAIFGDSSGRLIAQFLRFWYSEIYFFQTPYFHDEIADQCKPDILITESDERYLNICAPDEDHSNFLLYPYRLAGPYTPNPEFTEALSAVLSYPRKPYADFVGRFYPADETVEPMVSKPVLPEPAAVADREAVARFDEITFSHAQPDFGLLAVLESPKTIPQKQPAFIADLSGSSLSPPFYHHQLLHGSYLVRRENSLLFGPNHLVNVDGIWSCESRAFKEQFIHYIKWPFYDANYPGPKPEVEINGERIVLKTSNLRDGQVEKIDMPIFLATPLEPDNWGRWIVTVASKVMYYKKNGMGRKFFCQVKLPWQKKFLNLFGITDDMILEHHPGRTYICSDVMTVEYTDVNMTISQNERMMFFETIALHRKPIKTYNRLFISRLSRSIKSPHYRVLKNEVELAAMLAEFGFVAIEPETLSVEEQITMFAGAKHIVALGGAGIFNSVFCAPETSFVTIESSDKFINGHSQLLSSLDLNYGIIFGRQVDEQAGAPHANWTLDVGRARRVITEFIQ